MTADPTQTAAPAPQQQVATLYHSPDSERFVMEQRMAKIFVTSGLFSDIKGQTPEMAMAQAYVKIALGSSMGFSPAESMQGIDLIQGRPAISAHLRAARMQRAGFTWSPTTTNKGCWLALFYQGKPIMVPRVNPATGDLIKNADGSPVVEQAIVSYTEEDAKSAGLLGKDNYKKDPSAMYFARAITRAQRRFAAGVLSGDILSTEEAYDVEPEPAQIMQPQRRSEAGIDHSGTFTGIVETVPNNAPFAAESIQQPRRASEANGAPKDEPKTPAEPELEPWEKLCKRFGEPACLALLNEKYGYKAWETAAPRHHAKMLTEIEAQLAAELPPD